MKRKIKFWILAFSICLLLFSHSLHAGSGGPRGWKVVYEPAIQGFVLTGKGKEAALKMIFVREQRGLKGDLIQYEKFWRQREQDHLKFLYPGCEIQWIELNPVSDQPYLKQIFSLNEGKEVGVSFLRMNEKELAHWSCVAPSAHSQAALQECERILPLWEDFLTEEPKKVDEAASLHIQDLRKEFESGHWEGLETSLSALLAEKSYLWDLRILLAALRRQEGAPKDSLVLLKEIPSGLFLGKLREEALTELALAYYARKEVAQAKEIFEKLRREFPFGPRPYLYLAKVYFEDLKNPGEAQVMLNGLKNTRNFQ